MAKLNNDDLKSIHGGINFWTGAGIVGVCIFIIGVIDGFTRPLKCN